jgi:hypothetical protein
MPVSLTIPATITVQLMSLKAIELQLHGDLPQGGRLTHSSPAGVRNTRNT